MSDVLMKRQPTSVICVGLLRKRLIIYDFCTKAQTPLLRSVVLVQLIALRKKSNKSIIGVWD